MRFVGEGLPSRVLGVLCVDRRGSASLVGAAGAALEAIPVRGHIFLIGGAGSNITVSAGPDGVFLVDSGSAQNADRVLAAIKALQARLQLALPAAPRSGAETRVADQPRAVLPHADAAQADSLHRQHERAADHIGGNEKLALAGKTFTGGNVTGEIGGEGETAAILAHENVLRGSATRRCRPRGCRPTRTSAAT